MNSCWVKDFSETMIWAYGQLSFYFASYQDSAEEDPTFIKSYCMLLSLAFYLVSSALTPLARSPALWPLFLIISFMLAHIPCHR